MSLLEDHRTSCSIRTVPLILSHRVQDVHSVQISLVARNGELRNISTLLAGCTPNKLLVAPDLKTYSVVTESDYVWEACDDDGVYSSLSMDIDTKLKQCQPVAQLSSPINGQLLGTFKHEQDLFTVNFSMMQMSSSTWSCRSIRQGPPYWLYSVKEQGFIRHEDKDSAHIEEMYRFGGRFANMGGTMYTFMFTKDKSYQVEIQSGKMIEIARYPPIAMNPTEAQVNISIQGDFVSVCSAQQQLIQLEQSCYARHLTFTIPTTEILKNIVLHQMANVTRHYCVGATHRLDGDSITTTLYGVKWYVDMLHTLLVTLTTEFQHYVTMLAVCSGYSNALSVTNTWEPQVEDFELKPVTNGSPEWTQIFALMNQTLKNLSIKSIDRVQNYPLLEKYELERKHMEKRNNGEVNERYLFHGSRHTNPRDIVFSVKGVDFRYSKQNSKLMWGNGAYFAEKAGYSDNFAHHPGARGDKQLLLVRVLTGKSHSYGSSHMYNLTKPPRLPGSSKSQVVQLYDTVNGYTNGSKVYIVYDHDKSYPAYIITYQSSL